MFPFLDGRGHPFARGSIAQTIDALVIEFDVPQLDLADMLDEALRNVTFKCIKDNKITEIFNCLGGAIWRSPVLRCSDSLENAVRKWSLYLQDSVRGAGTLEEEFLRFPFS